MYDRKRHLRLFAVGIALGIIAPVLVFYCFFKAGYDYLSFSQWFEILKGRGILPKLLSLAAVPNLLLFYLCLWIKRDAVAHGVIGGTMIIGVIMLAAYFNG